MKKEFNNLVELLSNLQLPSPIDMALKNLEDKIDEVEKRMECARRSAADIVKTISKYTEKVDRGESFVMTVDSHDSIECCSNDIEIALDLDDDMCIKDNWYNVFNQLQPIAVGRIEYEFPEDVYTIGNADNTDIIGDVYESDFIKLCELGLIWCESDERFPIGEGNKTNYVVRNNEFIVIVKNKQIDLTKVPIKQEVFMTFESSWGEITCDKNGVVISVNGETHRNFYERDRGEQNYLYDIVKIDLVEYEKFLNSIDLELDHDSDDILSVGFWKKDNTYNEPDHDWRKNTFSPEDDEEDDEDDEEEVPTMLCQDKQKNDVVKDIIAKLKEIDVDGETMQYILEQVGMNEQMAKQLGVIIF